MDRWMLKRCSQKEEQEEAFHRWRQQNRRLLAAKQWDSNFDCVLPSEIMTKVLARLPVRSILRFRSVSKAWRNVIDSSRFRIHHNYFTANNDDSPNTVIILPKDCHAIYFVELPLNNRSSCCKTTKMDVLCPYNCPYVPKPYANGLLSFSTVTPLARPERKTWYAYVYNPVTRDSLHLPQLIIPQLQKLFYVVSGFGFDSSTQSYTVVQIVTWYDRMEAFAITLATAAAGGSYSSWRKLKNVPIFQCWINSFCASVNGSLHWLAKQSLIVSFDFIGSETFGSLPCPPFSVYKCRARDLRILNLGGCLSIADVFYEHHIELWIMKEYNVHQSWTKIIILKSFTPGDTRLHTVLPVCFWKRNTEILLLYDSTILVSYNIATAQYTPLQVDGIQKPDPYNSWDHHQIFPYVGNIILPKLPY